MTDAEKLVYAAALVRYYVDDCRFRGQNGMEYDEHEVMTSAAENAAYVVETLRESMPNIAEGFGRHDKVYKRAREMVLRRRK